MDPGTLRTRFRAAVPLTGKAGSITVHHVRAVHGSATNTSGRDRRLLLFQFRAADAWPLLGFAGRHGGVRRADGGRQADPDAAPRPGAGAPAAAAGRKQGSIYENQKGLKNRYFAAAAEQMAAV